MKNKIGIIVFGIVLAIIVILVAPLHCQTAKVVALSPEDAAKAKRLYDAKIAAEMAYAEFQQDIANRYVSHEVISPATACATICTQQSCPSTSCTPPKPTPEQEKASHSFQLNHGWWDGFNFSEDFRFIVPQEAPKLPTQSGGTYPWNCVTLTSGTFTPQGVPLEPQ